MKAFQIRSFAAHQTAKIISMVYFVFALVFVPLIMVPMFCNSNATAKPPFFILLFPFLYLILGYVFIALGCLLYNWLAGKFGGIEFNLDSPHKKTFSVQRKTLSKKR